MGGCGAGFNGRAGGGGGGAGPAAVSTAPAGVRPAPAASSPAPRGRDVHAGFSEVEWAAQVPYFLSAEVQRATSSAVSEPYGRMRASRKLPPKTSPRYWDQESSVP